MVRKHTRRAAKAAFAISFGVALLLGVAACGGGGKKSPTTTTGAAGNGPTIILGTKNFGEEYILGQLYGQALQVKGFHVVFKGSFGSSELANTAIKTGKMNLYPEYTGVVAIDLAGKSPKTAAATYSDAQAFEEKQGLKLLKPTPFYDTDTFTMLTSTAQKDGVKAIGDMKKVKSFSFAAMPECKTRSTCLVGLKNVYGLTQVHFIPWSGSVYTLLDKGTATAGDGFSTDPQQLSPKYTELTDTKHIYGFQYVAPVVSQKLLKGSSGMLLQEVCNAVSAKLTLAAMRAMNKAYNVDKETAAHIAHAFLKDNGLAG
jgi:osmoprotectant transport system substrate-binding protein